jgi:hypothetical protein
MLKLLQSIFGSGFAGSNYSQSMVKAAIEHSVDFTDPLIRLVTGYKKKLRPAVIRALDYVGALVDAMPLPVMLDRKGYDNDPRLRTYFISFDDMQKIIDGDQNLRNYRREHDEPLPRVYALMVMDKQERAILGVELSGDIVMHGVPQVTVSFDSHQFIDPCGDENETRLQLKHRALDHLLSLALRRITVVKTERVTLKRDRALLRSKLDLLQRTGLGFSKAKTDEQIGIADAEELLKKIEAELIELGDDRISEVYLDIVIDVLSRPEKHFWRRKEKMIIDRMCIKRSVATDDVPEVTLDVICDSEGAESVVSLVSLPDVGVNNNVKQNNFYL